MITRLEQLADIEHMYVLYDKNYHTCETNIRTYKVELNNNMRFITIPISKSLYNLLYKKFGYASIYKHDITNLISKDRSEKLNKIVVSQK